MRRFISALVTTSKLVSTRADMNLRIYSPEELLELRERWGMPMMRRTCRRLRLLYRLHEPRQRVFRIAVKHACDRLEKQRVLEPGKAFALAALQHHHRLRSIDFENRHARDWAAWIVARVRIHNVVSADHDGDVS